MRFKSLAWFYNARDTLLHIRFLQFDSKTPYRSNDEFFGGTDIESFEYNLKKETQTRFKDFISKDCSGHVTTEKIPYFHEEILGAASLRMKINFHTTELMRNLTCGEPLSKIIVRCYQIDETGRMFPFISYTFKECWLFDHETRSDFDAGQDYQIKFTYCCADLHYADGNRFAQHERCIPFEPTASESDCARGRENYAHQRAVEAEQSQEASRLVVTPAPKTQGIPTVHRFDVTATSQFNGKTIFAGGLDDIAFHVVEKTQSIDDLIDLLYDKPSEVTRTHFKHVNKHLTNGVVLPAQVVLISAQDSIRYTLDELQLIPELAKIENYRQNIKIDPLEFSKHFVDYGNLAGMANNGISFGTTYFQKHVSEIQKVLTELQDAYTHKLRMPGGALRYAEMKAYRAQKFTELNALVSKGMKAQIYGGMVGPKKAKKLALNPGAFEHDWKVKHSKIIPSLSAFYNNTTVFANTLKTASYLAIPLGAYETYTHIEKACTDGEEACTRAQYVEWSGFGGEVGGALIVGGLVGVAAVSLVIAFSVTGPLAIGIVAGSEIIGGYYGAEMGSEKMKDFGEELYSDFKGLNKEQSLDKLKSRTKEFIWKAS